MSRVIVLLLIAASFSLNGCQTGSKEISGTALGGAVGGLVGNQFGKGWGQIFATAGGVLVGGFIGNQIGQYLDEADRQKMDMATKKAVLSEKPQTWSNPANKTKGQARVISTKTRKTTVTIPVLKDQIVEVPPLEIIGQTYRAKKSATLRGGPGSDFVKVGQLPNGEAVNVVGKVKDNDWYFVSHNGIGSGFVWEPLVEPAPTAPATSQLQDVARSDTVEQEVSADQTCKMIEQSVTLADGETKSDTLEACASPVGWETLATS